MSILVKIERKDLTSFLTERYNSQISSKIINFLKIPSVLIFEEFLALSQQFFQLKRPKLLELAFLIHDFSNDGFIDIRDAYELMYISHTIKTY